MRTPGPYEVKPRQLRALVLLLMLLPLIPTAFVGRFMFEAVSSERREERDRERPIYQKFLTTAGATLAANTARQIREDGGLAEADGAVKIGSDGRLAELTASPLTRAVIESGVRVSAPGGARAMRWRFLCDAQEPIFALSPSESDPTLLLLRSRQHLLETISAFYTKALDPQSTLVLLDENGESVPLSGDGLQATGDPLAEAALKAPLPPWRIQLFTPSASLAGAASRQQFAFYFGAIGAVLVLIMVIGALAGLALSRRIVLRELSNDALAVAAHEMKTPLASVRLLTETLLEKRYAGGPAQVDEYLRLIAQENGRLERLVEGFSMLSRIERNQGRIVSPGVVDAAAIVAAATSQLRARLLEADFKTEIAGEIGSFTGDADALTAVLVNLLDNALKYSGERPWIRLRALATTTDIVFEVSDHGPGIPANLQEHIFERFYQVDNRLSRAQQGLGLGLSIVRSIVNAHGGEVTVESAPGSGSTFTVRLPRVTPEEA